MGTHFQLNKRWGSTSAAAQLSLWLQRASIQDLCMCCKDLIPSCCPHSSSD